LRFKDFQTIYLVKRWKTLEISRRVEEALARLGLSMYERKAYLALLKHGDMTAKEVCEAGDIPYSKVYEVLGRLEAKGWIESSRERPAKYYPIPPETAVRTSLLKAEAEVQEAEKAVMAELQPMYEKREVREKPDIWIIHGEYNILSRFFELALNSKDELLIAVPASTRALIENLSPKLTQLKVRGVRIMVMTTMGEDGNLNSLSNLAEVRIRDQMFGGGAISDGREAILLVGEEGGKPSAAIWAEHSGLVRLAKEYFAYLWREATLYSLKP